MKIIGITGGTGSGKTTLLAAVEARDGCVVDCDAVYHRLLEENGAMLAELRQRFPGTVECGALNRKKLGRIVFADPAALADLNAITHRYVVEETRRLLRLSGARLGAIDAIGLFESGLNRICQATVCVTAPRAVRVARLMHRENISAQEAETRISAQRPDEEFVGLCDYVLENRGTKDEFLRQCNALLDTILKGDKL